jgi:hypothetical protein
MVRWNGIKWDQLETSETKEDGTFSYYESRTNGFSSFAIAGTETQESISDNEGISETGAIINSTKPAATIKSEEKTSFFLTNWYIIISVFFVIGLIIEMYLWMKKK